MSTVDNSTLTYSLPHEEVKSLPEASLAGSPSLAQSLPEASLAGSPSLTQAVEGDLSSLQRRPTLDRAELENVAPPQYVGVDQGGGGCIVYRPDGTRTDLKRRALDETVYTIHSLSGISQEELRDCFLEEKKGKTLIKAELTNSEELEKFSRFFLAIWEFVVPLEFWNPATVFVCGMTGKSRKTLYELGLEHEWTSLIVSGMRDRGFRGYFLLLDCDFESLMEARDFNKYSNMLERAQLFGLVQVGSSSSQVSCHANIAEHRQVLCHGDNPSLGSRFTKKRRAELDACGVGYGPYFSDDVRHLFSKFDSLPLHSAILNAAGYIVAALVDHITTTHADAALPIPEDTQHLIKCIRDSEFVNTDAMCELIQQNMIGAPANEYFQFNLLLEILQTMYAKGNRHVLLERKLCMGGSYDGGIWSREFMSFLKTQPVPCQFEAFDMSTLP